MSLRQDFHVSPSVPSEKSEGRTTIATCGRKPLKSSEPSVLSTPSWKTSEGSWVAIDTLRQSSKTFPKRGMMRNGRVSPLPKLERRIGGTAFGYLPLKPIRRHEDPIVAQAQDVVQKKKLISTPRATDCKGSVDARAAAGTFLRIKDGSLQETIAVIHCGGRMNPTWTEWLMGWPLGATELKPLEMDKYQQFLQKHGES